MAPIEFDCDFPRFLAAVSGGFGVASTNLRLYALSPYQATVNGLVSPMDRRIRLDARTLPAITKMLPLPTIYWWDAANSPTSSPLVIDTALANQSGAASSLSPPSLSPRTPSPRSPASQRDLRSALLWRDEKKCVLTGHSIAADLEACHLFPVADTLRTVAPGTSIPSSLGGALVTLASSVVTLPSGFTSFYDARLGLLLRRPLNGFVYAAALLDVPAAVEWLCGE